MLHWAIFFQQQLHREIEVERQILLVGEFTEMMLTMSLLENDLPQRKEYAIGNL